MVIKLEAFFGLIIQIVAITIFFIMIFGAFLTLSGMLQFRELEHAVNDAVSNVQNSGVASGGIFDANAIAVLGTAEPVRYCRYGLSFKLTTADSEGRLGITRTFGMLSSTTANAVADKTYNTVEHNYVAWLRSEESIVPAVLGVKLYDSEFTRLSCAIEQAWVSNNLTATDFNCAAYQNLASAGGSMQYPTECFLESRGEEICISAGGAIVCRNMGDIRVDSVPIPSGKQRLLLERQNDRIAITVYTI